jgi:hypothetical protein
MSATLNAIATMDVIATSGGDAKPWRERPRCARPTWPRVCPEGSLTPWLSLSFQVVGNTMFGGEKRGVFLRRTRSLVI